MPNILIRDLPDSIVAEIDADAARLGVSRVEYIRRQLVREAQRLRVDVSVEAMRASGALMGDLLDQGLMDRAWR